MSEASSSAASSSSVTRPAADWLAAMGVPVVVAVAVALVDLLGSAQAPTLAVRSGLLSFIAGVIQIVIILSAAPWWGAGLIQRSSFGALIAGFRVIVMVAGATVLLLLLALLADRGGYVGLLKVQLVVLGTGLFVASSAGALRMLIKHTRAAAVLTSLAGFAVFTTPFWGNVLIRLFGSVGKGWAWQLVVKTTPMLACADASSQDIFRHGERMLYARSLIVDAARAFPAWWAYALITGLAGVILIGIVTVTRRHVVIRS